MRIVTRKKRPGEIEFGIIYGALAVLALVAARVLPLRELLPSCAFKSFTGISCPTCGTTRSLVHLAQGDVLQAVTMNPAFVLLLSGSLLFLLYNCIALFRPSRLSLHLASSEGNRLRAGAVALFLANWAYLVAVL